MGKKLAHFQVGQVSKQLRLLTLRNDSKNTLGWKVYPNSLHNDYALCDKFMRN
jgi:hypothetical protein